MLGKREILIMKHLLNAKKNVSSEMLAVILGASPKTIRNSLAAISDILNYAGGARLITKTGSGVTLDVYDADEFKVFMQSFHAKYLDAYWMPSSASDRVHFIIRTLLISESYIKMETLMNTLFISRVSLSKDLKIVRETLIKYHLRLQHRAKYGLKIIGNEMHIRMALVDYLEVDEDVQYFDFEQTQFLYHRDPKEISEIITQCLVSNQISISTNSIKKLIKYIIVAEYRMSIHHFVFLVSEKMETLKNTTELVVAKSIHERLNMNLNDAEMSFLAIFILSRRHMSVTETLDMPELIKMSREVLEFVSEKCHCNFQRYDILEQELARYLRGMSVRLKYGLEKRDVGILESKSNNPAYEMAVVAMDFISKKWQFDIQETELAFLSYRFYDHFRIAAFYRQSKILVILSNGKNAADLFIHELKGYFGEFISTVHSIEFYELQYINAADYDVIITDIPAIQFEVEIEIRRVNYYFTDQDILKLERFFKRRTRNFAAYLDCFKRELCFYDVELDSKNAVIQFLTDAIDLYLSKEIHKTFSYDDLFQAIENRESISSTERGNSVVVPHTLYPITNETLIAYARLKRPIKWENEVCQFVFMVIHGKQDPSPYIHLSLTKLMTGSIEFVYDLYKTNSYEDSIKVMKEHIELLPI